MGATLARMAAKGSGGEARTTRAAEQPEAGLHPLAQLAGKRRRVYISPIGQSDPFPATAGGTAEGPAVTICRLVQPDLVYLLPSQDRPDVAVHTMQQAQDTRDYLTAGERLATPDRIFVRPLDVSDVTDYGQVMPEFERMIRAVLAETGRDECHYFVNGSSGTPQIQMAAALLVAAGAAGRATLVQAADPRHQTRRERVVAVDVQFAVERQRADEALRLFDRGFYAGAGQLLSRLADGTAFIGRRAVARIGAQLAQAYAAMDQLSYAAAAERLAEATAAAQGTVEFAPAIDLLREQLETAQRHQARSEQGAREDGLFLVDVYHTAARRHRAGLHADALARTWRCLEGGVYLYLRERHGVEPENLDRSADRRRAAKVRPAVDGRRSLGAQEAVLALQGPLADEDFRAHLASTVVVSGARVSLADEWHRLRDARNRSVSGHGVRPVSGDEAERALRLAERLLDFLNLSEDRKGYCFRRQRLEQVSAVLRRELV